MSSKLVKKQRKNKKTKKTKFRPLSPMVKEAMSTYLRKRSFVGNDLEWAKEISLNTYHQFLTKLHNHRNEAYRFILENDLWDKFEEFVEADLSKMEAISKSVTDIQERAK